MGGAGAGSGDLTGRETSAINVKEQDTGHEIVVEQVTSQKSIQETGGRALSLCWF